MDALWRSSSTGGSDTGASQSTQSLLNDKLVEKIIYLALPASGKLASGTIETRVQAGAGRPGLSVPIMSRNFVQMNSRLGVPFMLIDDIIRVFNWDNSAYTLCIMSLYSFLILKPLPVLVSGPIIYILFGVMSPTYMDIHKPDPHTNLDKNPIPARGPPLKPPHLPGPVPEFSKEFILNLTDLQNHMTLYVMAYDFVTSNLSKFAYFKNENFSAAVFLCLLLISSINAMVIDSVSSFIPWRVILLTLGWAFVLSLHPKFRDSLLDWIYSEETRLRILTSVNQIERLINNNFDLYEPRERKLASIFELQRFNEEQKSWELIGYSTDHYTLLSESRMDGKPFAETSSALSLDDVKPPVEWEWLVNFNWTLDLDPSEWVSAGFVQGVEVDTETKWVYDIDTDGERGDYRRRRWVKICTRQKHFTPASKTSANTDTDTTDPNETDEDLDPIHPNAYNGYASVTQTSFSGADSSSESGPQRDTEDAQGDTNRSKSSGVVTSPSNASISSMLSQSSGNSLFQYTSSDKSKAVKSLTDLLNLTS